MKTNISNRDKDFSKKTGRRGYSNIQEGLGGAKKRPKSDKTHGSGGKKIFGAVLLSRGQIRSTIAAGVLNGRVREGNECFNPAMSTEKKQYVRPGRPRTKSKRVKKRLVSF